MFNELSARTVNSQGIQATTDLLGYLVPRRLLC